MTPRLFAWQRAILAETTLPEVVRLTALRVALDSSAGTGRDVLINAAQIATELGCSERTVWRRLRVVVAAGWLVQTAKPTYSGGETKGRRARYDLCIPALSSATPDGEMADDTTRVVCQIADPTDTRQTESHDTPPPALSDDTPSRLTNPTKSCATTGGDLARFLASHGSNTAAAADGSLSHLPGPVAILASKLAQHTPLRGLRWDISADKLAQIAACVDKVGDQVLVDHAISTLRHPVPTYASAFLGGWILRAENHGRHLALVKPELCTTHNTQLDAAGTCRSCAADQKAAR